ncbi:hypothetical protein P3102_34030 [Amycolatopsis sp. QT-25]|uniref:hypothetical protein n=1 Tax=Amycolatopsis sp. QT-25 TaxID=3034022 RepID=UPI0023ED1A00|nr:hypothetical protein [Amycolatopsis sp. QT-25]WET79001.1 hypothetical protein P3102_34030 [Amycolatopsis sp. QT-25]
MPTIARATLHGVVTLELAGALDTAVGEVAFHAAIPAALRGWVPAMPSRDHRLHDLRNAAGAAGRGPNDRRPRPAVRRRRRKHSRASNIHFVAGFRLEIEELRDDDVVGGNHPISVAPPPSQLRRPVCRRERHV